MLNELSAMASVRGVPIDVINVDLQAAARARYGHKIPVLLLADELVCHGTLDPEEVDKALAHHRRPV